MSSSTSSPVSPVSPASSMPWIQRQSSITTGTTTSNSNRRAPTVEPLNLWPSSTTQTSTSTSTWAAYSSALASLSLGQLQYVSVASVASGASGASSASGHLGETTSNSIIKYPSRCSPLTPTTPTNYSPTFSPQQTAAINSFGVHPLLQPDSPHSVIEGAGSDYPSTAFPLDFCTTHMANGRSPTDNTQTHTHTHTHTHHGGNKRRLVQVDAQPISHKKSKSFTIDAILGLEEFAASCCHPIDSTINKHLYHHHSSSEEYHHHRSDSPPSTINSHCQQQRRLSLSESPDSSPPPSSLACASSSLSTPSSSPRAKRVRTIFSAEQLERLETEFARQQYMVGPERLVLAASLRLSESQVKVWFQNRRIKWRKQHLESQQMRLVTWRQHEEQTVNDQDHQHSLLIGHHDQQHVMSSHHHHHHNNSINNINNINNNNNNNNNVILDDDQSESFSD